MVYNLDESGITTVQSVAKVIAEKGTKQMGQITAQERGTLVTVCCCSNAARHALPPAMIFPRVNLTDPVSFFAVSNACYKKSEVLLTSINFSEQMIFDAISEISASSAPGPDGIQASFWKKCAIDLN